MIGSTFALVPANDEALLGDEDSLSDGQIPLQEEVVFGRYRLCYELGSGGMATVYLARAEGPGRFAKAVAIKRIHPHLARRKDFVAMFLDEARIASRVSHPNICSTFDFGEVDGTYYMAMEYLVGEPLSNVERVMGRHPEMLGSPTWNLVAARIVADVCEGLHAAHELKDESGTHLAIVHRDVSPQNVFVTYEGAVKLVDFGVALAKDRITHTTTGTLKGKYSYMAPEQLSGAAIDRRVDVWALGVMLWELLTGERLFRRRSDGETLLAVQTYVPPPPSMVRPGIPLDLDLVVRRALERNPDERYPTARAMGRELTQLIARSGHGIGMPEISELMAELFAARRPEKLEVLGEMLEPSGPRRPRARKASGGTHSIPSETRAAPPAPRVADVATAIRPVRGSPAPGATPDAAPQPQPPHGETSAFWRLVGEARTRGTVAPWLGVVAVLAVAGMAGVAAVAIWATVASHDVESTPLAARGPTVHVAVPTPPTTAWPPPSPPTYTAPAPADDADAGDVAPPPAASDAGTVAHVRVTHAAPRPMRELALLCDTWADVTEGSHSLGRTPTIAHVREGTHTLEFHTPDGRVLEQTVDVGPQPRTRAHCRGR